jgi:hypothetical protein
MGQQVAMALMLIVGFQGDGHVSKEQSYEYKTERKF